MATNASDESAARGRERINTLLFQPFRFTICLSGAGDGSGRVEILYADGTLRARRNETKALPWCRTCGQEERHRGTGAEVVRSGALREEGVTGEEENTSSDTLSESPSCEGEKKNGGKKGF